MCLFLGERNVSGVDDKDENIGNSLCLNALQNAEFSEPGQKNPTAISRFCYPFTIFFPEISLQVFFSHVLTILCISINLLAYSVQSSHASCSLCAGPLF